MADNRRRNDEAEFETMAPSGAIDKITDVSGVEFAKNRKSTLAPRQSSIVNRKFPMTVVNPDAWQKLDSNRKRIIFVAFFRLLGRVARKNGKFTQVLVTSGFQLPGKNSAASPKVFGEVKKSLPRGGQFLGSKKVSADPPELFREVLLREIFGGHFLRKPESWKYSAESFRLPRKEIPAEKLLPGS